MMLCSLCSVWFENHVVPKLKSLGDVMGLYNHRVAMLEVVLERFRRMRVSEMLALRVIQLLI